MDLTVFRSLANAIEDSRLAQTQCGQQNNATLEMNAPDAIVQDYKTILLQNPGKKVPELYDAYLKKGHIDFFMNIYWILQRNYKIWKSPDSRIDDVAALTKKLIDYSYDMTTGRLRLARMRKMWPQFLRWSVITRQEPHDFHRSLLQSRENIYKNADEMPKKVSFTVLHALACLCTETLVEKPIGPGDNGLAENLQESNVFKDDMALEKTIFETVQQDMDAFAQTFSAQIHASSAILKLWVEAVPQMQLQNLKMKFESKQANGPKDQGTIQRNMVTQLALMWYYVMEMDNCSKNKNFKKLYNKLTVDAAAWAFTNSFLNSLDQFYNTKTFKMPKKIYEKMAFFGEILQQLILRMCQIVANMTENRNLREQFIAMDYWTLRLSISNPQQTVQYLKNDTPQSEDITKPFIFWGFGPDQWTPLTMEQFGLSGLEGSDDVNVDTFPKNHVFDNVMALMGVVLAFTQTMEHLWAVLTNMQSWKARVQLKDSWKKDKESPIDLPLLQIFPDGSLSKKPSWMNTRQEMIELRNEWKLAQNAAQKVHEESIWGNELQCM